MTESQISEYQELININLNKIKRQVNQIEPRGIESRGCNSERYDVINSILEDIRRTVEIMTLAEYKEELKGEKNK